MLGKIEELDWKGSSIGDEAEVALEWCFGRDKRGRKQSCTGAVLFLE